MSARRQARLLRSVFIVLVLAYAPARAWSWWADLDPWQRSSVGLFVAAVVLFVWGIAACLREHRLTQERACRARHPAGSGRA